MTCFTDEQVVGGTKEPRTVALLAMAWSNSSRCLNAATLTEMGISDEEERQNHVQRSESSQRTRPEIWSTAGGIRIKLVPTIAHVILQGR
jgi:hypothetical protein